MTPRLPLQLSYVFDSVPRWVAPLLIILGIELVLVAHIERNVNVVPASQVSGSWSAVGDSIAIPVRDYRLIISGLTLGILLSAIAVIQSFQISHLYAMLLLFCGRAIEGAAAVRFYKKVIRFLRTREFGGNHVAKVKHKLTMLFILVIGIFLMGYVLLHGPFLHSLGYTIQFIWTITTLLFTSLGLRWKLRHVDDQFDWKIILGVILFVTGAELFNFTLLGNLLATIVGSLGYTVGFWIAAAFLIRDQQEPVVMELKRLVRRIRINRRS